MDITLNGASYQLSKSCCLADLLTELNLSGSFAIVVNQEIISRSKFTQHNVYEGDIVEIVQAVGGG